MQESSEEIEAVYVNPNGGQDHFPFIPANGEKIRVIMVDGEEEICTVKSIARNTITFEERVLGYFSWQFDKDTWEEGYMRFSKIEEEEENFHEKVCHWPFIPGTGDIIEVEEIKPTGDVGETFLAHVVSLDILNARIFVSLSRDGRAPYTSYDFSSGFWDIVRFKRVDEDNNTEFPHDFSLKEHKEFDDGLVERHFWPFVPNIGEELRVYMCGSQSSSIHVVKEISGTNIYLEEPKEYKVNFSLQTWLSGWRFEKAEKKDPRLKYWPFIPKNGDKIDIICKTITYSGLLVDRVEGDIIWAYVGGNEEPYNFILSEESTNSMSFKIHEESNIDLNDTEEDHLSITKERLPTLLKNENLSDFEWTYSDLGAWKKVDKDLTLGTILDEKVRFRMTLGGK